MKLASDAEIKSRLIRLAFEQPELRKDILPLVTATEKKAYSMGIIRNNAEAMKVLPTLLGDALDVIAPKFGKAIAKDFPSWKPNDKELQAQYKKFLTDRGSKKLAVAFGSWFQRLLKQYVMKAKFKFTKSIQEWDNELLALKDLVRNPNARLDSVPDESPLFEMGHDQKMMYFNTIRNSLSRAFVGWLNQSGAATVELRKQAAKSVQDNAEEILASVGEAIWTLAAKGCPNKVFISPIEEEFVEEDIFRTASFKVALNWSRSPEVDDAVEDMIGASWVKALNSSMGSLKGMVCAGSGDHEGLRLELDAPNPQNVLKDMLADAVPRVPSSYTGSLSKITGAVRASVKGVYLGGYDPVTKKAFPSVKVAKVAETVEGKGDDREFRASLIRLAHEKKHLRAHLLPLLQENSNK